MHFQFNAETRHATSMLSYTVMNHLVFITLSQKSANQLSQVYGIGSL
jgi:hypothetical protein